jgi:hypothetical protein
MSLRGRREAAFFSSAENPRWSELYVCPQAGDNYRAAVAVVAGIDDVLHSRREIDSAPDMRRIVGLENVFAAVVQMAIAEEETQSTIGQIILMVFLDSVGEESDAGAILLAMPLGAADSYAFDPSRIDLCVGE